MTSVPRHRSGWKIRRTGQHKAPSPAAKAARKAGKAAPALAVAGTLTVAAPAHKAAPDKPAPHKPASAKQVIHMDAPRAARTYTVQPGDSLSAIARRFYRRPIAWPWLYELNRARITGPGLIRPGQMLNVPLDPPAGSTAYRAPAAAGIYRPRHAAARPAAPPPPPPAGAPQRIFSYAALERLWVAAGGNPADKAFAACIAERESGGHPGAISATGDYGLWQEHDDPAALDPAVSATAAVRMSSDGTNWSPWTTRPGC